MPKGLAFLHVKSWHTQSGPNRERLRLVEAEQRDKVQKDRDRQVELKEEREHDAIVSMVNSQHTLKGKDRSVAFMYKPPPGFIVEKPKPQERDATGEPAVKVEGSTEQPGADKSKERGLLAPAEKKKTPYELQIEKHPVLKGAPVVGEFVKGQEHHHKPLGIVLVNAKCIRCGQVGHRSGDRECPMYMTKSAIDIARQAVEDPLAKGGFIKGEPGVKAEAGAEPDRFESRFAIRNVDGGTWGGLSRDHDTQQILVSSGDEEEDDRPVKKEKKMKAEGGVKSESKRGLVESSDDEEGDDLETQFLQSLSRKEMKTLLRQYKKMDEKSSKKKKKKKHKKSSRSHSRSPSPARGASSSSSSSAASSTTSDAKDKAKRESRSRSREGKQKKQARSRSPSISRRPDRSDRDATGERTGKKEKRDRRRSRSRSRTRSRSRSRRRS